MFFLVFFSINIWNGQHSILDKKITHPSFTKRSWYSCRGNPCQQHSKLAESCNFNFTIHFLPCSKFARNKNELFHLMYFLWHQKLEVQNWQIYGVPNPWKKNTQGWQKIFAVWLEKISFLFCSPHQQIFFYKNLWFRLTFVEYSIVSESFCWIFGTHLLGGDFFLLNWKETIFFHFKQKFSLLKAQFALLIFLMVGSKQKMEI